MAYIFHEMQLSVLLNICIIQILSKSNGKNKVNVTSRLIQTYITTMNNLTKEIVKEREARLEMQKEILIEQQNIRIALENHTKNIEGYF